MTKKRIKVNRAATGKIARGLRAISDGFPLVCKDDHETVERASFVYDAKYAAIEAELTARSP